MKASMSKEEESIVCEPPTSYNSSYLGNEGYRLMGSVFEVYNEQGFGLAEEIYQESLAIELEMRKIAFSSKQPVSTFYKGVQLRKEFIPDFIVYDEIIVELKSVKALLPEHEAQLINYMRITRSPVGYLVNFGPAKGVQWKRLILSEFINPKPNN